MRIVLDTNVLVSAIGWNGNERALLLETFSGDVDILMSEDILDELLRVLSRKKLAHVSRGNISQFCEILFHTALMVETEPITNGVAEDPSDNRVLECALAGKADYIVTGDRHLLRLRKYKGIRIINAKRMLGIIERS